MTPDEDAETVRDSIGAKQMSLDEIRAADEALDRLVQRVKDAERDRNRWQRAAQSQEGLARLATLERDAARAALESTKPGGEE